MNPEEIAVKVRDAEEVLLKIDRRREEAIAWSRELVRNCSRAIAGAHSGQEVSPEIERAEELASRLSHLKDTTPEVYFTGYVQDSHQEYAEMKIFHSLMDNGPIPGHTDLGISPASYLTGLADVVGELRRAVLGCLKKENILRAQDLVEEMEHIYDLLCVLRFPNVVLPIKRKQDMVRGILEKTRGELVITKSNWNLSKKLDSLQ